MGAGEGYFYELFGVWVYVVGTLRRAGGPTNWRLLCARLDILG